MLAVRGAPSIGVAAAMGYALAARRGEDLGDGGRGAACLAADCGQPRVGDRRDAARREPTRPCWLSGPARSTATRSSRCVAMGEHAAALFTPGASSSDALQHRRARDGRARLGARGAPDGVRAGAASSHVFVDETRPLDQGARLTAWELERAGIPYTVIVDGAAGALMAAGEVTHVFVGADRIAANGDVANKIGTYSLAVLADYHEIPLRRRRADLDDRSRRRGGTGDSGRGALAARGLRALLRLGTRRSTSRRPRWSARSSPRPESTGRPTSGRWRPPSPSAGSGAHEGDDHGRRPRHEASAAHGLPPQADGADREPAGAPSPPEPARRTTTSARSASTSTSSPS